MRGTVDIAFLRQEKLTTGIVFKPLVREPVVVVLPAGHRLAARKTIRPQELEREIYISSARVAPVLKAVIEEYAARVCITLEPTYDAENLSGAMSLVASTGGLTLFPLYVRNILTRSFVTRPLRGEPPTIELMMGYNKSNTSQVLNRFLSRADELVDRVSRNQNR
jgi:LysR family hca operon transcriptional activator